MDSIIPTSFSLHLPCAKLLVGTPVKIHVTLFVFAVIELLASLRFVATFPLYCVLVIVLCGPIWIVTVLVHEWGHLWMSRRILGGDVRGVVLWPLGGYTFCDGLTVSSPSPPPRDDGMGMRGNVKDDLIIALAGSLTHVPMCLFWVGMYASINNGDVTEFTFRNYLTVISSGCRGFFSTLFEQACLINLLLLWFNLFVPVYPADGGRLMTSFMLLSGMALNKVALLTVFASTLVSLALFAWSVVSFVDGIGITGVLTILIPFFIWAECYRLYLSIVNGELREHPLFGRDCYIYRNVLPSMFQLSTAARSEATGTETREQLDLSLNITMVSTETDVDQLSQVTDMD